MDSGQCQVLLTVFTRYGQRANNLAEQDVIELLADGPGSFKTERDVGTGAEVGKCLNVIEIRRMNSSWNGPERPPAYECQGGRWGPTQRGRSARLGLV